MKRLLSLTALVGAVTLVPVLALAGPTPTGEERNRETHTRTETSTSTTVVFWPGGFVLLALSPYTSTTTSMAMTTAGTVGMAMSTTRLLLPRGRACRQAVAYLRTNHRELQEDLLMGGGPAIDDLAFLSEVPEAERAAFGQALRQRREELLPLLHPELGEEEATAFLLIVLETVEAG